MGIDNKISIFILMKEFTSIKHLYLYIIPLIFLQIAIEFLNSIYLLQIAIEFLVAICRSSGFLGPLCCLLSFNKDRLLLPPGLL